MSWQTIRSRVDLAVNEHVRITGELLHDSALNALCLVDSSSGEEEILTVDLLAQGYVARPDEVFVKAFSEHSCLPVTLVDTGVCEYVAELYIGPFGAAVHRLRVLGEPEGTGALTESEVTPTSLAVSSSRLSELDTLAIPAEGASHNRGDLLDLLGYLRLVEIQVERSRRVAIAEAVALGKTWHQIADTLAADVSEVQQQCGVVT